MEVQSIWDPLNRHEFPAQLWRPNPLFLNLLVKKHNGWGIFLLIFHYGKEKYFNILSLWFQVCLQRVYEQVLIVRGGIFVFGMVHWGLRYFLKHNIVAFRQIRSKDNLADPFTKVLLGKVILEMLRGICLKSKCVWHYINFYGIIVVVMSCF